MITLQENIGRKDMLVTKLSEGGFDPETFEPLYKIEMQIAKTFEFGNYIPNYFELQDIEISKESKKAYWISNSTEAICPFCGFKSTEHANLYYDKEIQDIPINGIAVFHLCRVNKYKCFNPECTYNIFVERTNEFCVEDARKTERFKKYCILQALQSNCLSAEQVLKMQGAKISNDTISRYTKEVAGKVIEDNLQKNDVVIISVDDINLKKGDKSSACTVFLDEKTHRILIIIRGTNKEAVAQVLEKFKSSKIFSSDRACSFSSVAKDAGKTLVADRFHLIENAQAAVKEALMSMIPARIFVREGDGWVSADGQEDTGSDTKDSYFYVPDEVVDKRVEAANLTEKQEVRYRNTLKILELSGKGMRTADIAKILQIDFNDVQRYRRVAVETMKSVTDKIEKNVTKQNSSKQQHYENIAKRDIKTVVPTARPSNKSIVEPFRETVLSMLKEGGNHRTIHPVLKKMGFEGSPNAVYQYTVKVRKENIEDARPNEFEKPPAVDLGSVTQGSVYRSILKEASKDRPEKDKKNDENIDSSAKVEKDPKPETQKRDSKASKDSTLTPEIKKLMYDKGKSDEAENTTNESEITDMSKEDKRAKKN